MLISRALNFFPNLFFVLPARNRWNRCVEWTNKKMGMAVGALFIRDNFNYESKVLVQFTACNKGTKKTQ